jgi:hypothetical protein
LPTISGDINYELPPATGGGGSVGVSVGPTDWLELLNFAALVSGSASKGKLTLFGDLVYLSLGKDDGGKVVSVDTSVSGPGGRITIPVDINANLNTDSELDGLLVTLAAGYTYRATGSSRHSLFAGVRRLDLDFETAWDLSIDITTPGNEVVLPAQGSVSANKGLWDGIVGLRGNFDIGDGKWSVPYYFDVGKGDSDLTWNALAAFAREFGWGQIILGYRHLEYDEGPDGFLQGLALSGPGIGARFSF